MLPKASLPLHMLCAVAYITSTDTNSHHNPQHTINISTVSETNESDAGLDVDDDATIGSDEDAEPEYIVDSIVDVSADKHVSPCLL